MLSRYAESQQLLERQLVQLKKTDTNDVSVVKSHIQQYNNFVKWFCRYMFECLFPGASFGRRHVALEALNMVNKIIGFDSNVEVAACVWTKSHGQTLLECLKDSYENNKLLALELLKTFPSDVLNIQVWLNYFFSVVFFNFCPRLPRDIIIQLLLSVSCQVRKSRIV